VAAELSAYFLERRVENRQEPSKKLRKGLFDWLKHNDIKSQKLPEQAHDPSQGSQKGYTMSFVIFV
jgi:hypothetical protein